MERPHPSDTRMQLLLAAGELFAEHGFDGVSTRMIAEKAGVNLGGIHYHFGSKETLYVDAFRYVCEHDRSSSFAQLLHENPELKKTDLGMSTAIWMMCSDFIQGIFSDQKPEWHMKLLVRELSTPSAALPLLVRDLFQPETEDYMAFFLRVKPDASQDEAMVWSMMAKSQIIFMLIAQKPLETMRNGIPLDDSYIQTLSKMTAISMIHAAGLPVPEILKSSKFTKGENSDSLVS